MCGWAHAFTFIYHHEPLSACVCLCVWGVCVCDPGCAHVSLCSRTWGRVCQGPSGRPSVCAWLRACGVSLGVSVGDRCTDTSVRVRVCVCMAVYLGVCGVAWSERLCACVRVCVHLSRTPLAHARERALRSGWTDGASPAWQACRRARVCVVPPSRPCSHRLILCSVRLNYLECPPCPRHPGGDRGETCLCLPSCGLGTRGVPWREAAPSWLLTLHSLSAPWRITQQSHVQV